MNINELIELLEEAKDIAPHAGETEVRIAYQESYPIAGVIGAISVADPFDDEGDDNPGLDLSGHDGKLWIAASPMPYGENPYGPDFAWTGAVYKARG